MNEVKTTTRSKTTIIKDALKLCKKHDYTCSIFAPTGKVVSKIRDDLETYDRAILDKICSVSTMHKFLVAIDNDKKQNITHEYYMENSETHSDSDQKNNKNNKYNKYNNDTFDLLAFIFTVKLIIIDEVSMLSNTLFKRFLDAIQYIKVNTNIVLLGDPNQLPSIECGNILSNLLKVDSIPKTTLIQPMRFNPKSGLFNTINQIKNCEIPHNSGGFEFIKVSVGSDYEKIVMDTVKKTMKHYDFSEIMVITPTRANIEKYGESIRKMVHKINKISYSEKLCIGDYIILTKNVYTYQQKKYVDKNGRYLISSKKDLFNGMIGQITDIVTRENNHDYFVVKFGTIGNDGNDNRIEAHFDIEFFNQKQINSLSYINTVHKYQGSENKIAIFILTDKDKFFPDNKLLYTAISRAKEKCILISDEDSFNIAIKKQIERKSCLESFINGCFDECKPIKQTKKIVKKSNNKNNNQLKSI